jgi:hypothetical protein
MPKDKHGYDYIWAFIDKFSRILASIPGQKINIIKVLAIRYYRSLYRFFGLPLKWITDNAGPFVSTFMEKINMLTGIKYRHGSALYLQI